MKSKVALLWLLFKIEKLNCVHLVSGSSKITLDGLENLDG